MQSKTTALLVVSGLILTINYLYIFEEPIKNYLGGYGSIIVYLVLMSPVLILNRIKIDKEKEESIRFILGIVYLVLNFALQLSCMYLIRYNAPV